ncbi:hypothetical protein GWK47_016721 [Chionoecetes opilio]|uniref:Uncharacterized protein n=1 Tax=Chionoecetes opilio TaxID=41210 RepID=A0A8J5CMD3_CHIOP|nr:hypothetical protein GWK47_016721 [Chionoecetes opilio]
MFTPSASSYLKGDTNWRGGRRLISRYPILSGGPEGSDEDDEELGCAAMTPATPAAAKDEVGHVVDLHQVEEEAARDEGYRLLRECVANDGWAERKDWERSPSASFFKMRAHLSWAQRGKSSFTPVTRNTRGWS